MKIYHNNDKLLRHNDDLGFFATTLKSKSLTLQLALTSTEIILLQYSRWIISQTTEVYNSITVQDLVRYGINNFVNVMADCQYSRDSTFGVIASSIEKYA